MTRSWLRGVPGVNSWRKLRPVFEGRSQDEKYEIFTQDGRHLLLRAADARLAEEKYAEFTSLQRFQALGFPMPRPIDFGLTGGRVYQLMSWVEGESLTREIIGMPDSEQYRLGQEAGRALAAMHSTPVEPLQRARADKELSRRMSLLNRYRSCRARMAGDDEVLAFLEQRLAPPQRLACLHGDFHIGNMVMTPEGKLGVIDFNRTMVGDRWQDFQMAQAFTTAYSLPFVNGQLHGYFGGDPPQPFWEAFAYHTAFGALALIEQAARHGPKEVRQMQLRYVYAMRDFRGFTPCEPPRWYQSK